MRKTFFLAAVILLFTISGAVFAQNSELPQSGMTPDNPLYFFKEWKESIQTFFTFGAENKAKQFLHLSEVRLAEYLKMTEKGKTEIAQKTLEKYEKQLNQALEKTSEKVALGEKILKHKEVLRDNLESAPENAKSGIEKAIVASLEAETKIKQKIEEALRQAPPKVQECVKSTISQITEKQKGGDLQEGDIQKILLGCLEPGAKVPSGDWLNADYLKTMEDFYGKNMSAKDSEALKKMIEQYKEKEQSKTGDVFSDSGLNLDELKKLQEDLKKGYENIPEEDRKKMEELLKDQENTTTTEPPELNQKPGNGMGL